MQKKVATHFRINNTITNDPVLIEQLTIQKLLPLLTINHKTTYTLNLDAIAPLRLTPDERDAIDVISLHEDDIQNILNSYKEQHHAGWDGITISMLHKLPPSVIKQWITTTSNNGTFPSSTSNTLLQPIPKKNNDLQPISIES